MVRALVIVWLFAGLRSDEIYRRSPQSTQHYAKIMPAKLTQSYAQAGYFERNRRLIDVLVDQEAVKSGAVARHSLPIISRLSGDENDRLKPEQRHRI